MVRNAVKFIFIRKMREKSRRRQTRSSGVLWPIFGQIGIPGRCVRKTSRSHIFTSGLATRAPCMLFFALFWLALSPYRTWTATTALNMKTGCTKSKSVARKYSSETGSTLKSARNSPKCYESDCNSKNACKQSSWSNLKWICKTGSSCVLWPTFGQIENRVADSKKGSPPYFYFRFGL